MVTRSLPLSGRRYQIDWDSTINDFDGHYVKTLNEKFGTTYTVDDLTHWDWVRNHGEESVDYMWGIQVFNNRNWNLEIPAKSGAVLAVNKLLDAGAIVDVVSARPPHHKEWLEAWLEKHGIWGKYLLSWINENKSGHAEFWNVDIAVDDSPKAVEHLARVCPVYLVDMPYNQDVLVWPGMPMHNPVFRVPDLYDAVEKILEDASVTA